MSEEAKVPPPGSDAALALGCRCPVLDNAHGAGIFGLGKAWWYSLNCPVHAARTAAPDEPKRSER